MTALAKVAHTLEYAKAGPSVVPAVVGNRLRERSMTVTVENLVKEFGQTAALHGVSLEIAGGELIALLGPSGSGKTTLLRLIAGLDFPTSGRVLFGNEDASSKSVQERNVGFVFQNYALFRHMTVFENLAFGLRVRPRATRPSETSIRERVMSLLDLVQLSGLEKRFPGQLSGGQRQRVAFARALAIEPRVLLLDEPFGALDAKVRRDLRRWLREVHDRTGHTTLFVTHDQEEALELADRVAIFNRGVIEQIGTPDDVLDQPATAFVAGFVGEAVRLPVDAAGSDLVIAKPGADAIPARVIGVRRSGTSRRAELSLADDLPTVEIELPEGRTVRRGDRLPVVLATVRLFTRLPPHASLGEVSAKRTEGS
jgi:sulfate transport system ATP-binding protein